MFGHALHMHQTGMNMVTRQYRNDVLIDTAAVEYYSFEQAGFFNSLSSENTTIQVRNSGGHVPKTYTSKYVLRGTICTASS